MLAFVNFFEAIKELFCFGTFVCYSILGPIGILICVLFILERLKEMRSNTQTEISKELRLCSVFGTIGYFHTWEQYSDNASAQVYGIVEFRNEIKRVDPKDIHFIDETHDFLNHESTLGIQSSKNNCCPFA